MKKTTQPQLPLEPLPLDGDTRPATHVYCDYCQQPTNTYTAYSLPEHGDVRLCLRCYRKQHNRRDVPAQLPARHTPTLYALSPDWKPGDPITRQP